MFGRAKEKPAELTSVAVDDKWEVDRNVRKRAATEAWSKLEPGIGVARQTFVDELSEDKAAYRFSCERFGEFMRLTVTRLKAVTPSVIDPNQSPLRPVAETKTINLSGVTEFRCVSGSDVGKARVTFALEGPDAPRDYWYSTRIWSTETPLQPSSNITAVPKFAVTATRGVRASFGRPMSLFQNQDYRAVVGLEEAEYPCRAEDDQVVFIGSDVIVQAPFGSGQSVVDALHAELSRYAKEVAA